MIHYKTLKAKIKKSPPAQCGNDIVPKRAQFGTVSSFLTYEIFTLTNLSRSKL